MSLGTLEDEQFIELNELSNIKKVHLFIMLFSYTRYIYDIVYVASLDKY